MNKITIVSMPNFKDINGCEIQLGDLVESIHRPNELLQLVFEKVICEDPNISNRPYVFCNLYFKPILVGIEHLHLCDVDCYIDQVDIGNTEEWCKLHKPIIEQERRL